MPHVSRGLWAWVLFWLVLKVSTSEKDCGISHFHNHRQPRASVQNDRSGHFGLEFPATHLTQNISERLNSKMMVFRDEKTARIVGGKQSAPGAWPWQVSLQLIHPRWGRIGHWCGGVLIHKRWIVTAAHCIKNQAFHLPYGPMWKAVVGAWDRTDPNSGQSRSVEKIAIHERFKNYNNDIALMKLKEAVSYTDYIQPICLPDVPFLTTETFLGIKCISVGWGMRTHGARLESRLKEVEVPVLENVHCAKMYGMLHNIPVKGYHICAGSLREGGTGTCIGDSGGPLQCNMKDGKWYLAGITSFGSGCAKPGFPDVYTRITYYLPWIKHKMRSL